MHIMHMHDSPSISGGSTAQQRVDKSLVAVLTRNHEQGGLAAVDCTHATPAAQPREHGARVAVGSGGGHLCGKFERRGACRLRLVSVDELADQGANEGAREQEAWDRRRGGGERGRSKFGLQSVASVMS